jgi:hypothetical protein
MAAMPPHLGWLDRWTAQLDGARSADDVRAVHRWMWSTWGQEGPDVAAGLNAALHLEGKHQIQPDVPNLFAGQVDTAELLFVNINPGWHRDRNPAENTIVAGSEEASWDFCRALFTRYPEEVGPMAWWNQTIGLGWRIIHGCAPVAMSPCDKRAWANVTIAGWELLPHHAQSAGFLSRLGDGATGCAVEASLAASLGLAMRLGKRVTIVASKDGARLARDLAVRHGWSEVDGIGPGLPQGSRAFHAERRLLIAVPRPLSSKYSGLRFEEIASAIRRLRPASRPCAH